MGLTALSSDTGMGRARRLPIGVHRMASTVLLGFGCSMGKQRYSRRASLPMSYRPAMELQVLLLHSFDSGDKRSMRGHSYLQEQAYSVSDERLLSRAALVPRMALYIAANS